MHRGSVGLRSSPSVAERAQSDVLVRRRLMIGESVGERVLWAFHLGDADARQRVLVVGCIHGDECAGVAVARRLLRAPLPASYDLWVIPNLNPDGALLGSRQNADRVDLNRNFPYRWRRLGHPGTLQYAGSAPLSEPESRAAYRLVRGVRPTISIWFHQALDLVDLSGGSQAIERRFARLVGLPVAQLPRYPGSVTGWQNAEFAPATAFVVELPPGRLAPIVVTRYADGVQDLPTGYG
jgi:murein peptide amidase A